MFEFDANGLPIDDSESYKAPSWLFATEGQLSIDWNDTGILGSTVGNLYYTDSETAKTYLSQEINYLNNTAIYDPTSGGILVPKTEVQKWDNIYTKIMQGLNLVERGWDVVVPSRVQQRTGYFDGKNYLYQNPQTGVPQQYVPITKGSTSTLAKPQSLSATDFVQNNWGIILAFLFVLIVLFFIPNNSNKTNK